jgi:hypothetical protein
MVGSDVSIRWWGRIQPPQLADALAMCMLVMGAFSPRPPAAAPLNSTDSTDSTDR